MMLDGIKTAALLPECDGIIKEYLYEYEYPWQAVPHIEDIIMQIGASLDNSEYLRPSEGIWISRAATVAPTAYIGAPAIIMPSAELRHGAFIRRGALIGCGAVVGNSTEVKNAIFLDRAAAPHFNYVGDSILGYRAHLGAGVICSNLRLDKQAVRIRTGERILDSGIKKLGAIVGDRAEIGCSSVLNPGTVICAGAVVYPLSSVCGFIPSRR